MRKPYLRLRSFSRASSGGTSPQSPEAWRSSSRAGFSPADTRSAIAPGVATTQVEEGRGHQARPPFIAAKTSANASAVIRSHRLLARSAIHAVP
jgi:hypothetical protein